MKIQGLFPEEYRAFVNGELSVCVERFGGINEISLLDVRKWCGKSYPDRNALRLFTRQPSNGGAPLQSPAIEFHKIDSSGCVRRYCPVDARLRAFGFESATCELWLENNLLCAVFPDGEPGEFVISIGTTHLGSGHFPSLKNHVLQSFADHQRLSREDLAAAGINPDEPFPENGVELNPSPPQFSPTENSWTVRFDLVYQDHAKSLFAVLTANRQLRLTQTPEFCELATYCPPGCRVIAAIGFAPTRQEAFAVAQGAVLDYEGLRQRLTRRFTFPRMPHIKCDVVPEAAEFATVFPEYQNAMLLAENRREVGIRAAAHKFGFFAIWDHVYPIRDFLLAGEPEVAARAIRYMLDYPYVKRYMWLACHIGITLNEYWAFTHDDALIREALPILADYHEYAAERANSETGLLPTRYCCGNDNAREAGLDGDFYAACINGWWYDFCRTLENIARHFDDRKLAKRCLNLSRKLDQSYISVFYSEETGYLRQAVLPDFRIPPIEIFQNTNTLALDYPYGDYLLRKIFRQAASYQANQLYHPSGHTAVSRNSRIPCDMWRAVHMNQHLGHECKLARLGGRADEALRLINGYLEFFARYRTAVETFNLTGCLGNQSQNADWQTFSATGAMQGLWHGAAGIDWHRGGIFYHPAEDSSCWEISNFHFQNHCVDIRIDGTGYFAQLEVNGVPIPGTLQIPVDRLTERDAVRIHVRRSRKPPIHPVLYNATDLSVRDLSVSKNMLNFCCSGSGHCPVQGYAPKPPAVFHNGIAIECEWELSSGIFRFDAQFENNDRIAIREEKK